jgi:nitric oxide reductase activation protein
VRPAPAAFGTIRRGRLIRGGAAQPADPTLPGREAPLPDDDLPDLPDDEGSDGSRLLKLFENPLRFQSPIFKLLRNLIGMGRQIGVDGEAAPEDLPVSGSRRGRQTGVGTTIVTSTPAGLGAPMADPAGDRFYQEWDCRSGRYREHWCRVGAFDPAGVSAPPAGDIPVDPAVRRELARLGLAPRRHDRQAEGETLDTTALVDFAVARASGEAGDTRVYQARLRTAHDLGVVVLLDASGSTAEDGGAGATVWDKQRRLAGSLIAALEEVGDRVAGYGFMSHGRHDVRFLRVKEFDGRFDHAARTRLRNIEPEGFTRMGAAIRHSAELAAAQAGTSNRLLVVISDGFPYDDGYEARYAEQDTRRALDEAVERAVGCVCVSVGTSTDPAALRRLWGNVSHVGMIEPGELGRHLLPLFRAALHVARSRTHDEARRAGRRSA